MLPLAFPTEFTQSAFWSLLHPYGDPAEFFYDPPEEAIQHCIRLGPQFFLDTQYYPSRVTIIRGFEQHNGHADEAGYDCIEGAMTESIE